MEINTVKAPVVHANPPYGPGANTSSEDGVIGYDAGPPGDNEVIWSPMDNPHYIRDNYTIESGWWLKILPGCDIRFDSGINLSVQGILEANGGDIGITFTSNQSVKSLGDWTGIIVDIGSLSTFNNCIVEYSTDGVYVTNMMGIGGGIHNSILRYNLNYGVYLRDVMGGPPVWNCDIYNNSYGVYSLSSTLQLNGNDIFNNTIGAYSGVWTFPVGPSITQNNITDNSLDGILTEGDSAGIYDNKISYNGRHGINATPSPFPGFPATPYIMDNIITNNSGCGIHTVDNQPVIGSWGPNNILNNSQHGIFIENTNGSMGGVEIGYNNIQNNSDGIRIVDESPLIKNNYLAFNSEGINLLGSSNCTISNNTITSSNNNGIDIWEPSTNNTVDNNTITYNYHGMFLSTTTNNNTITNNDISYNTHTGLLTGQRSNHNNISYNTISNNGWEGIQLTRDSYNNITYNEISLNGEEGIGLGADSNDNTINGNNISNNYRGIWLYTSSNNNTIISNNVWNNEEGIGIWSSHYNTVTQNTVWNNGYNALNDGHGIEMDGTTSNNKVFHNNIIHNANQALDTESNNSWNDSYPSGGNYWSDYDGVDIYKGPNQDIFGNDSIGDTNYTIDADSADHYPMMYPIGDFLFLYEGWNLVSIPYIQSDEYLDTVFKSIEGSYDSVQWYNVSDSSDHWKDNHTSKPDSLNDLEDMGHTRGFWIHIIEPRGVLFQYSGIQPAQNQTIALHEGWNMVGFPSLRNHNRTEGLNNLTFGKEIEIMQWYEAETQTWYDMGVNDYFVIGRGYWIYAKTECEWEVPL
jgi:parallel beta-helix repeat protein